MATEFDYATVLNTVAKWPMEQRASLAQALIETLKGDQQRAQPKPSIDQIVGIARGDGPAPTDEQVTEWVDEYRTTKYGGGR